MIFTHQNDTCNSEHARHWAEMANCTLCDHVMLKRNENKLTKYAHPTKIFYLMFSLTSSPHVSRLRDVECAVIAQRMKVLLTSTHHLADMSICPLAWFIIARTDSNAVSEPLLC